MRSPDSNSQLLACSYAVLLAFAIIVVWEKFTDAGNIVAREAGAATNVYRLSYGMAEAPATSLRARLSAYLAATISDDWPAMEHAKESSSARLALDAVYGSVLVSLNAQRPDSALVAEILHQLDEITQARRARIFAAEGTVPGVIWPVLFGGLLSRSGLVKPDALAELAEFGTTPATH